MMYDLQWLPTQQRIATVKLGVSFDSTGRVQPRDRDGQLPVFRTRSRSSPRQTRRFYGEILFTASWLTTCWLRLLSLGLRLYAELLLPMEILVEVPAVAARS